MNPRLKQRLLVCPCGDPRLYMECCGALHAGARAETPEALMRSRYSAYVLRLPDYLLRTWHPSTSPGELEPPMLKWTGLTILDSQTSTDAGVVEFVATFKDNGRAGELREISRFTCVAGDWLYIDGQVSAPLPVRQDD